ncbi:MULTISPECIES: hypothetical protein [unclassified Erwinia]|uniref:hypothetical protein n=1 Tax=unclassified Erwinia TaxID=2622719 RepID=UPI0006F8950E|nr:hypothetical protein ASF13_13725 [Erwinia sp. Leaf53]PLV62256.1 hypothetical protein NV64_05230 [Erwinia sp. B116]
MKQGDFGRLLLLAAIRGASFMFMRVATPVFGSVNTAFLRVLFGCLSPLKTLTVTFLIPPFGVLWGYLFLGETLSGGFISGGLVIIVAVWLVTGGAKPAAQIRELNSRS